MADGPGTVLTTAPAGPVRDQQPGQFELLAAAAGPALDDLTALAARLCAAPMALVSVIDGDRLLFKSRVGLEMSEIARKLSFCEQAMTGTGILIVPDTRLDPRFRDSPLVTGSPGIRFYAGTPLVMGRRSRGGRGDGQRRDGRHPVRHGHRAAGVGPVCAR